MTHVPSLTRTLDGQLRAGGHASPAFHRLLDDYVAYHAVFLAVGGPLILLVIVTAGLLWRRRRRARAAGDIAQARAALGLAGITTAIALFMVVVLVANVTTVVSPHSGFVSGIHLLAGQTADPGRAQLHHAYDTWLRQGRHRLSPAVSRAVDARLHWQRPKAIICAGLLVLVAVVAVLSWRALGTGAPRRRALLLSVGSVSVLGGLLLMAMVIGNAEASVAPLALTMLYG